MDYPRLQYWLADILARSQWATRAAEAAYAQAEEAIRESGQMRGDLGPAVRRLAREIPNFYAKLRHSILTVMVDSAARMSGAEMGNIQLFDPASATLRLEAQRGFEQDFIAYFEVVRDTGCACGAACFRKMQVAVGDVADSPVFLNSPALEVVLKARVRSVQSTPLIGRSGAMLGVISTHRVTPYRIRREDLRVHALLASNTAAWLEEFSTKFAIGPEEGANQDSLNERTSLAT